MESDNTTQYDFLIMRRFEDTFPAWMIAAPIAAAGLLFLMVMLQRRSHAHESFLGRLVGIFNPPWAFLILAGCCAAYAFLGYQLISLASWWLVLAPVLAVGLTYVGIMYFRDSRSVGPEWASLLGVMRTLVYLILAFVFLLPAWQSVEKTERRSRVVVLFDVSASMAEVDDVAEGGNLKSLLTRQQKILGFLTDEKIAFINGLLKSNPVTCYRFGKAVDPVAKEFSNGSDQELTGAELRKELTDWLIIDPTRKGIDVKVAKQESDLYTSTNLAGAVRQVLEKQEKNMLQGIVIFSDGQSNQEEDVSMVGEQIYEELREEVKRKKVPLLCVGVGKFKPPIGIRVNDLEAPTTARPDEPFLVNVPVLAQGLKDKPYQIILEFTRIRDGEDKPVAEPIIELKLDSKHKEGEEDRAEFQIDVPGLKKINLIELRADKTEKGVAALKAAIASIEGTWEFRAKVARDKREAFAKPFHTPEQPARVKILQKKLRVLMFAGGPSKEYQFVRTLLFREVQANRMEMGIYLQTNKEEEIDLDENKPQEWVLDHFPIHRVRPNPKEKPYTLFEYDAIIAFDPDWGALQEDELKLIREWVNSKAGGLIIVAGPVNTYQLRELGDKADPDTLTPIRDLCPVILEDSRLLGLGEGFDAAAKYPLKLEGPLSLYDFMKLDEDGKGPGAGWNEFFFGDPNPMANAELENGFYTYYPVKRAKAIAQVLATFPRPGGGTGLSAQPWIAAAPFGQGNVVYIGSLEMWQLRNYKAKFHQHFWVKLVRYIGAGNMGRVQKFGQMNIPDRMLTGEKKRVEYQLRGPDGKLLGREDADKHKLQVVLMPFKKADDAEPDPDPTTWNIYPLKGKPGGKNEKTGWFQGEFPIEQPGKYQVRLAHAGKYFSKVKPEEKNDLKMKIPGTEEELIKSILVTQPNPEMDNVKPDLVRLYNLASDNDMVLPRIPKELEEYKTKVTQLKGPVEEGAPTKPRDGRRLYFDLESAKIIPFLMISAKESRENKGKTKDLRDEAIPTGLEDLPNWLLASIVMFLLAWFANILILQHEFKTSDAFPSGLFRFAIYFLAGIAFLGIIVVAVATWFQAVLIFGDEFQLVEAFPSGPARFAIFLGPTLAAPFLLLAILWVAQQLRETPKVFRYARVLLQLLVVSLVVAGLTTTALLVPAFENKPFAEPVMLAVVMFVIVVFLSLEWLTRKLLRLA